MAELGIAGGDTVTGPTGAKETLTGAGLQEYENDYITPIFDAMAAAPSNVRFVLVVEDDSLPNIVTNTGYSFSIANCVAANGGESYPTYSTTGVYVQAIQYALNQFHTLCPMYITTLTSDTMDGSAGLKAPASPSPSTPVW